MDHSAHVLSLSGILPCYHAAPALLAKPVVVMETAKQKLQSFRFAAGVSVSHAGKGADIVMKPCIGQAAAT